MEESERRARLHELDGILDALERLNLQDANQLPVNLRERLHNVGLDTGAKANVTELIERIWELQEGFLSTSSGAEAPAGQAQRGLRPRAD
ncbi:MAG TPA: hypothetical protein VNV65_11370 [Candidatus Solibacter sp.]|jgi:hypothetical protein|nr:hypothetical protein [Candidatus Solibacter sp.]